MLVGVCSTSQQPWVHLYHHVCPHLPSQPPSIIMRCDIAIVCSCHDHPQVIDFGLSHLVSNSAPQRVSKAGGTLVYAAPEVFTGTVSTGTGSNEWG
jgi:hypothetical protein